MADVQPTPQKIVSNTSSKGAKAMGGIFAILAIIASIYTIMIGPMSQRIENIENTLLRTEERINENISIHANDIEDLGHSRAAMNERLRALERVVFSQLPQD